MTTLPTYAGKEIIGNPTTSFITHEGKNYEYKTPEAPKAYTKVDRYAKEKEIINTNPALNVDKPNESKIREQYRSMAQGTISAIRSQFDRYIQEDTEAKKRMESKAYLRTMASGLSGSPTGAAQTTTAAEKGEEKVRKTRQEGEALVQQALNDADLRASEAYGKQRAEYLGSAQDKAKAEGELASTVRSTAEAELTTYAANRTYDEWAKQVGPERVQQYMQETGKDEMALQEFFIKAKEEDEKVFSGKTGDSYTIITRNKATGKTSTESIPLPKEDPGADWKLQEINDTYYWVDTKNQRVQPLSGTSAPGADPVGTPAGKPVVGAPKGITSTYIAEARSYLKKFGKNGYAEPAFYVDAYQSWKDEGGTDKGFLEAFPPSEFVNPSERDLLPTYLQPKEAKKTTTTTPTNTTSTTGRSF